MKISEVVALVILLALVISIPILIWGLKTQEFDVRKKAASGEDPNKPGYIMVSTPSSTAFVGEIFPVDIEFRPNSIVDQTRAISSITMELSFPVTNGNIEVVNADGQSVSEIEPNSEFLNSGNWAYPFKNVIREDGQIRIELAAINVSTQGYISSDLVTVARFYLKVNDAPDSGKLPFSYNQETTTMLSKADARDILGLVAVPILNIANEPLLSFGYRMQGVSSSTPTFMPGYELTMKDPGGNEYYYMGSTLLNYDGVLRNEYLLTLDNLPVDTTYTAYVKDSSHLRKELGSMSISSGINEAPANWEDNVLVAGDFDGNNILDIIDVGRILSEYKALQNSVNSVNQIYDVNHDNVIDIFDMSIVISNYTELQVFGD